jgi:hypothetical protein
MTTERARRILAVVSDSADRFMLLSEVATEARVSISSVRHWLRTGRLRSVRPARRRLVRLQDFERFLAGLALPQETRRAR